jgi:starch synthase
MPSRYEPCGLNQMMSLRYGTVPIVRATGGLDDTVKAFRPKSGTGNGFKFKDYSSTALLNQINKARLLFSDKPTWRTLMKNGMSGDYSWDRSSKAYIKHYQALKKSKQEPE